MGTAVKLVVVLLGKMLQLWPPWRLLDTHGTGRVDPERPGPADEMTEAVIVLAGQPHT